MTKSSDQAGLAELSGDMDTLAQPLFTSLQGPDVIDALATAAARAAQDGTAEPRQVRLYLSGLLFHSQMPHQVARAVLKRRWPQQFRVQVREDLTLRCIEMLGRKLEDESFSDLGRFAAGESFSAWGRQLLRSPYGARSELRNLYNAYMRHTPSAEPIGEDVPEAVINVSKPDQPEQAYEDRRFTTALAAFADEAHGARPEHRKQIGATHLCRTLGLPKVRPLTTTAARETVARDLESDPKVAYRVVCMMSRGVLDATLAPHGEVFDGFTADDLETIRDHDWRVAAALATAAAAAVPPVIHRVAQRLRRDFLAMVPPGTPAAHLARLTVTAWLAASTTMIGDEYSPSWSFKSDEQVAAEAAEFTRVATLLVRSGGMPNMVRASDIEAWLEHHCEQVQSADRTRSRAGVPA